MEKKAEIVQIGNCCPTVTRDNPNQGRVYSIDGIAPTLTAMTGGNREPFIIAVRQLTELEMWRLMGFTDEDFYKAKSALNETFYYGHDKSSKQLKKMAGNSICVPVAEAILSSLFESNILSA